jgi:hypothetical protein
MSICRSAAKTRLISAMDFVNRLKPEHLQSFWYFASKVNFAIVGTFGSLLWATAPNREEADFYKSRLGEYRWTLRVSSKGAEFMVFAVTVLDTTSSLLKEVWNDSNYVGNINAIANITATSSTSGSSLGPIHSDSTTAIADMLASPSPLDHPLSGLASPSTSTSSYEAYLAYD